MLAHISQVFIACVFKATFAAVVPGAALGETSSSEGMKSQIFKWQFAVNEERERAWGNGLVFNLDIHLHPPV